MAKTPNLAIGTAWSVANTLLKRLAAIVPGMASDLSPSLAYLPVIQSQVDKTGLTSPAYGWIAPDLNAGQPYTVQVECYGAGGGGGGGSPTIGGGGGGAGEYASEAEYPIEPNETYTYFVSGSTTAGILAHAAADTGDSVMIGVPGSTTHFDYRGKGITGGVLANGGEGGDTQGIGVGGRGGTGSGNTIHFDGGDGGSSTSGVASDNPVLGLTDGLTNVVLNWRMDDGVSSAPAHDYSTYGRNSSSVIANTGAYVTPSGLALNPAQVPFGPAANWDGKTVPNETASTAWEFAHGTGTGYIGGVVAPVFTLAGMAALSVSVWIKGLSSAANAKDWGGDSGGGKKVLVGNRDMSNPSSRGWALYLDLDASTLNFICTQSSPGTTTQTVSCAMPAANDGNWHMCTVTYAQSSNHVKIYVDGTALTTTTATVTAISGGPQPIVAGLNKPTLNYSFKGYMSNIWIYQGEAPSSFIAFAYGNGVATGGSGGGASGGSAGAGNSGAPSVGSVGGAGGAGAAASQPGVNHGSGPGAGGGNASAAGANASPSTPTGGGGGGAGTLALTGKVYTAYLPCNMSGSYTGFDAQGAGGGQLYTVSVNPQADVTSPWYSTAAQQDSNVFIGGRADSPFHGSMFSVLTFPSLATVNGSAPQGAGVLPIVLSDPSWTIVGASLRLTINTANACNLLIGAWRSNTISSSLPANVSSLNTMGYAGGQVISYIPAGAIGRQVTIDLTTNPTLVGYFQSLAVSNGFGGSGCGLIIGQLLGISDPAATAFGAWNDDEAPDWNAAITGANADNVALSATLVLKYGVTTDTRNTGGTGAPGYIVISYSNPEGTPIATVLPTAITDDGGNQLGAGFTADAINYNTWKPGTSPKQLETWNDLGSITVTNMSLDVAKYRIAPGNLLQIYVRGQFSGASATQNVAFANTLTSSYQPTGNRVIALPLGCSGSTNTVATNYPAVSVFGASTGTPGRVELRVPSGLSSPAVISGLCQVPLDL